MKYFMANYLKMLRVPWWIFLISSLCLTANFLDIFSASNGVFSIFCHVSHINNLDIFSVVSPRPVFIFSWCLILSTLLRSSKGLLSRYVVGHLIIKFLSSLSGDLLSVITIFSRASRCELFRCFVGNFMTNFLEILSFVLIFFDVWRRIISIFHLASHGKHFDILSDVLPSSNSMFFGHLTAHYLDILSGVWWWKTSRYTKVYYAALYPSKQY
jgi:hypothetical protein